MNERTDATVDDEPLPPHPDIGAYVRGELSPEAPRSFEHALATDPVESNVLTAGAT